MAKGTLFTDEQRMEIVKRIAWFWRTADIDAFTRAEFKKSVTQQNLYQYQHSPHWMPVIEKLREKYLQAQFEVPMANKRVRLEELQRQYEFYRDKDDKRTVRSILKDIREEMEPKKFGGDVSFNFTQVTNTQFNSLSDEELAEERIKTIEELKRVKRLKFLIKEPHVLERSQSPETGEETKTDEEKVVRHEQV